MPFVVVSNGPMGSDAFGAPQKTIRAPEPDGPSGPGTTKLAQRSTEAPEPVQSSLSYPLDAGVAADKRPGCLGRGRTPPWTEKRRLRPGADLAETHPGCVSGGTRTSKRLSPGTTGRTTPTAVV